MDYEQKYHEALERAKTLFESQESSPGRKKWLSDVFPELRESEVEKTRKDLRDFILNRAGYLLDENTEHRFIAYLEKKKPDCKTCKGYQETGKCFVDGPCVEKEERRADK